MAMASTSNTDPLQFDVEKDLPEFLFKVLDRTGECINTDTGQLQAQLELELFRTYYSPYKNISNPYL